MTQPLFSGGQTVSRVNLAYHTVAGATADLQTLEEQVLINAISGHMDVVKSSQVVDLSIGNENALKEEFDLRQGIG